MTLDWPYEKTAVNTAFWTRLIMQQDLLSSHVQNIDCACNQRNFKKKNIYIYISIKKLILKSVNNTLAFDGLIWCSSSLLSCVSDDIQ